MIEIKLNGKNLNELFEEKDKRMEEMDKQYDDLSNRLLDLHAEVLRMKTAETEERRTLWNMIMSVFKPKSEPLTPKTEKESRIKETTVKIDK